METAVPFPFAPVFAARVPGLAVADLLVAPADGLPEAGATRDLVADALAARDFLRNVAPSRFFAGAGDSAATPLLLARLADHCREITSVADMLEHDRAWQQHGRSGTLVAQEPSITAEPGRHQWLIRLAQAYTLTGDRRYVDACIATVDAWLSATDAARDEDFATSNVAGSRLIAWCWTLMLLRGNPEAAGSWSARVMQAMQQHAGHLSQSLSRYCPPPTHLTGNALALLYAGTLLRDCPEAAQWRDQAVRTLVAQSAVQIGSDGVHVEQSTCFHVFTVDVYLQFLLLAARNGIDVPPSVAQRVERLLEFLLAIRRPDGSIPAIGDSDGRSLLPLANRAEADSRGRFAVAATLFKRADFAWAADGLAPEVVWLMGEDGAAAFSALTPAQPLSEPSRVFPSGGYAVMRTGWDRDAHQMIMDVGPLGCSVSGGHGHADILGLQCAIFGESAIVDPGTHCYGGESKWRDYFRSSAAHSTVMVDGAGQAEPTGPFGWRRRPRVRLREWHSTPDFDFVDAEHDGYSSLPDPVMHRRRVIFVKPGYWIVVDDLSGAARHQIDLTFQFATHDVRIGPHPWARAATPSGSVLWISPFPSGPAQPALKCGEPSPTRGWISPEIARLSPAPMLIYSFAVALPWRIVTLLLPDRQGLSAPPAVTPLFDRGESPHGFIFERPRRVVRFNDRAVLVERD